MFFHVILWLPLPLSLTFFSMWRIFGKKKEEKPAPTLDDASKNLETRTTAAEEKVKKETQHTAREMPSRRQQLLASLAFCCPLIAWSVPPR